MKDDTIFLDDKTMITILTILALLGKTESPSRVQTVWDKQSEAVTYARNQLNTISPTEELGR